MRRDFTLRKRTILGGVILLVLADVGLAAYSWQLSSAPRAPREQLAAEIMQHNLLKADIKRAQDIRGNIPAIQKDCDQFEQSLFPASSGYSSIRSELGATAKKSGIQLEDQIFKETKIANRREVCAIAGNVTADWRQDFEIYAALAAPADNLLNLVSAR